MLVLSRRVDEEILFPNLDIRIKILRSAGNRVRLGIEAPQFVEVARAECENPKLDDSLDSQTRHELRNRVNTVRLALELYDRQTNRGDVDSANQTFLRIVSQLRQADLDRGSLSQAAPSLEGPKVLVVEDDPNERELLAGLLQMDGCRVEATHDGLGAIECLKQGSNPDVVLLDMHMPRLDGKGTLATIRDRWSDLLVFGISGSTPAENGITIGGPQGIDEWFQKPLNPGQLVKQLRQRLTSAASVYA
jgi:carbon storage regulator CsrA